MGHFPTYENRFIVSSLCGIRSNIYLKIPVKSRSKITSTYNKYFHIIEEQNFPFIFPENRQWNPNLLMFSQAKGHGNQPQPGSSLAAIGWRHPFIGSCAKNPQIFFSIIKIMDLHTWLFFAGFFSQVFRSTKPTIKIEV